MSFCVEKRKCAFEGAFSKEGREREVVEEIPLNPV
jgi:hypothetical protein